MALYANDVPKLSQCLITNSRVIQNFTQATALPSSELVSIAKLLSYCCVAKPPPLRVISCGRYLQEPSSFTVGCGPSGDGIQFTGMTWSAWGWSHGFGHGKAIGRGTVRLLDCRKLGRVGRLKNYPAEVTLSDPRSNRSATKHPSGRSDLSYSDLSSPIHQTCDIQ